MGLLTQIKPTANGVGMTKKATSNRASKAKKPNSTLMQFWVPSY